MAFYEIKLPKKYIEFDRFYVFSNINSQATAGRVYFKSAATHLRHYTLKDYQSIEAKNIPYDGLGQALKDETRSTVCISDPGIFLEGKTTSWYSVVDGVDICYYFAQFLSYWFESASLTPSNLLMFGFSAGSFAALRTATFLTAKTNVVAMHGQIKRTFEYKNKMYEHNLLYYYKHCLNQQKTIPNIYLIHNHRDKYTFLMHNFFELLSKYSYQNNDNYRPNISLEIYDGLDGHHRPRKQTMLEKINIAEAVLRCSQSEQEFQRKQEQLDAEITIQGKVVELKPNNSYYYKKLSKLQQDRGEIEKAILNLQKAIEINSDQPAWVYQHLAKALSQQQQLDEAVKVYHKAIKLEPDNSSLYRGLAKLQAQKGDLEKAIANYRKAIELNSDQPVWVYQHLNRALRKQNTLDESMTVRI
ncbi:MAG: tetratricopeptide repeat protein [Pleurocapsa sp.]